MFRVKYWVAVVALALVAFPASTGAEGAELDLTGSAGTCNGGLAACQAAGFADLGGGLYQFAGAIWTVTTTQPTGSGYIDSFVRIQDQSGSDYYVVDGHNTSAPSQLYKNDEQPSTRFTHDVMSADLQLSDPLPNNGVVDEYYRFLLDINQTGTDPLLSLSGLQICTAGSGGMLFDGTCANSTAASETTSVMKYDLDGTLGGSQPNDPPYGTYQPVNNVLLNYSKNSGSGSGDLWVYIPKSTLFPNIAGPDIIGTNDYLYLWSQFGLPKPYNNNDGYEEWAFMHSGAGVNQFEFPPTTHAPEPATLVMLGTGLLMGGAVIRRRNRRQISQP